MCRSTEKSNLWIIYLCRISKKQVFFFFIRWCKQVVWHATSKKNCNCGHYMKKYPWVWFFNLYILGLLGIFSTYFLHRSPITTGNIVVLRYGTFLLSLYLSLLILSERIAYQNDTNVLIYKTYYTQHDTELDTRHMHDQFW